MNTDKQCPAEAIPQGFFLPGNMLLPIPEKYGKISIGCGSERTAEKNKKVFRKKRAKLDSMRIFKVYPKTKARTKTMDRAKEQVFIDAVRERRHQMYRVALGYLHSAQDAEDAVSDAVESTWKSLKHIRNEEAIPAYLIRCTINAAKSMLRKKKRTEPLEPYQETLAVGESGDPITDYLSGMKEKDQLLLVLKYQENLREADIASILNIPRGTVSSRINTLLGRIREQMSKEGLSCD